jgi:uncharacterized repeat protein (TIGR01451 family)
MPKHARSRGALGSRPLPYVLLALLLLSLLAPLSVSAEGSRSLFPAAYPAGGARAPMDVTDNNAYAGVARNRQFLYVYAQAGEFILLGSRNRSNGGDIFVYNPQSFGTRGLETVPGTADFTCSAATPPPGSFSGAGRGTIATRAAELAGPNSADGTVTATDGWLPCAYRAPVSGIYGVRFTGATSGTVAEAPTPASNPPLILANRVSAWEVQVRAAANTRNDINGRLFTYAWIGRTGGNGTAGRVFHTLYYITEDGYRYEQRMNALDPFAYALYANRAGFLDGGAPLYKSIRGDNQLATNILPGGSGISAQAPQYPIFFSDVRDTGANDAEVERVLGALGLPSVPPVPQLTSVTFTGTVSPDTTTLGAGGVFTFTTVNTLTYEIVVSRDGVDFDPANPVNKVLTGNALSGTHSVWWNGRDNSGALFPVGTGYRYRIAGRNGEVHFPIIDTEGMSLGGPTVRKLNGSQDAIVYFDDRGYVTRNGTAVGQLNGHICGAGHAQVQPTPNHSLLGVDSSDSNFNGAGIYYRFYPQVSNDPNNDCTNTAATYFGTAKGLDLWALERTPSFSEPIVIVNPVIGADVGTVVTVDGSAFPGQTVFGSLIFYNAGDTDATGVGYTAVIGTPGNCPASVNFTLLPPGVTVASYNPSTCAVTFTGLPASLPASIQPTSQLVFEFNYPAPSSGPQVVQTTISAANEAAGQIAPNSASGSTAIIVADVATTVTVPASAITGSTVSGSVSFSNLGSATSTAAGLVYSVTIGSPGSCPAGIDFPGIAPATFSVDPGTCVVSFSGLPAALDPGNGFSLNFQYTAPAPGTVPVSSSISTSTPESSTANNTANGSTLIQAQPEVAVSKTSVPATGTPVSIGGSISYSVQVVITGGPLVSTLELTDTLGTGLSLGTVTAGPFNCNAANPLICSLPGGTATGTYNLSYTATVNSAAAVSVANSVAVTANGGDPTPSCSPCTTSHPVIPPQLSISKTASAASFVVGVPASYTLSVTNTSTSPTTAVATVSDSVPASLTLGAMPANCSAAGQTVTCTIAAGFAPAASVSFVIPVTPTAAAVPSVNNTATVGGGGDPGCPGQPRCTSSITTPVNAPELTLTKTASVASFVVGTPASYTLTVQNTGSAATTAVATVSDDVPASLTVGAMPANCSAAGQTVTCTIAAGLAAGANVAFVIPVTPTAAAVPSVNNTATVGGGGDPGCPGQPRCTSSITTPVNAPELTLTKTASVASFVVGTPASYTLTVQNTGSAATTAVATVSDDVPASLTLGAMPANCSATGQTVTCTIAAGLAAGANVAFVIPVTPTAAAVPSVNNTATVGGGGDPGCPGQPRCTSSITTPVNAPELTLTKTASVASFVVGTPASYTLTVQNTGSAATTAVATVSDDVPASLTLGAMPANCAAAGQTVTCTIAAGFAPAASVSFVIPVTPTAAAVPSVNNTATVGGGGDPGCPGQPRCTSSIVTPVNAPELTLTKTASVASFVVGTPASYTLTVQNTGSAATTAVATVSDDVPASLTLGAMPANCSATGQTVTCTIAAGLAAGANVAFVIPVTPTAAAVPSVNNTATVGGGGDPGCPGQPRCTSSITTPVNAPELTLTKTASVASFVVGTPASYTLTVQNTGSAATTAVATVSDDVPASLTLGAMPANCSAAGQTVTCTIAAGFAPAASVSFVIPVTPTAAAVPSVNNTATVGGGGDPGCPGQPRCTSSITTPVNAPELTLTKTASVASFVVGTPASYTLTVQNTGSAATTAVATVSDDVPASLTLGATPANCAAAGQTVTCTIAAGFAPAASVSFVIPVTPTAAAVPSVNNTATVGGGGDPGCPGQPRCTSSIVTPVNAPELTLTKTASVASFVVGTPASYTLTVQNTGSAATTAVATVSDDVPASLTLGAMPANCSATGQTVTCTIAAGLAAGANVAFVIPVTPTAAAVPSVNNTATVGGGGDPGCPGQPRCTSSITTPVGGPNVSLAKTANPTSGSLVSVGTVITYTLQLQVTDAALIAPFELTDTLGAGLARGAVTAGTFTCGSVEPLVCSLPAGTAIGSYSLSYTATVQAGASGSVGNAVTISGNGGDPTPVCTPCTTTHPLALADLEVIKTVDQMTPRSGEVINFTLQVHNYGPDAATNVRVTDALPSGFTLLGTTASQGSYAAPIWTVGSLAVGQTETLTMQVRVLATGNYRNAAVVQGDQSDPVTPNNDDNVTPTPLGLPRPATIPADANWALLSLMLLMFGIAGWQLRRRD